MIGCLAIRVLDGCVLMERDSLRPMSKCHLLMGSIAVSWGGNLILRGSISRAKLLLRPSLLRIMQLLLPPATASVAENSVHLTLAKNYGALSFAQAALETEVGATWRLRQTWGLHGACPTILFGRISTNHTMTLQFAQFPHIKKHCTIW